MQYLNALKAPAIYYEHNSLQAQNCILAHVPLLKIIRDDFEIVYSHLCLHPDSHLLPHPPIFGLKDLPHLQ